MIIERANMEDSNKILTLQKLAYVSEAELYNNYSIPPLTETIDKVENDIAQKVVLKVTFENQIVGSVRGFEKDGTCYIGRLMVHPDFQNQGIGKLLLKEIDILFSAAERFELFTGDKSEKNLSLYKKVGYKEFKRKKVNPELELIYLEKCQGVI